MHTFVSNLQNQRSAFEVVNSRSLNNVSFSLSLLNASCGRKAHWGHWSVSWPELQVKQRKSGLFPNTICMSLPAYCVMFARGKTGKSSVQFSLFNKWQKRLTSLLAAVWAVSVFTNRFSLSCGWQSWIFSVVCHYGVLCNIDFSITPHYFAVAF